MFNKSEIKERFEAGIGMIDRFGNVVDVDPNRNYSETMLPLLLHYRLLAGMTDQEAAKELATTYMLSEFEITFLINNTKVFIKNVLEIDLEEIRANKNSTATLCGQMVIEVVAKINEVFERKRYENLAIDDVFIQADKKSREIILGYLAADTAPEYWVTADNVSIECDHETLVRMQEAIVARDAAQHEEATELKKNARELSEKRNYAGLVDLLDKLRAM